MIFSENRIPLSPDHAQMQSGEFDAFSI